MQMPTVIKPKNVKSLGVCLLPNETAEPSQNVSKNPDNAAELLPSERGGPSQNVSENPDGAAERLVMEEENGVGSQEKGGKFSCKHCSLRFSSKSALLSHLTEVGWYKGNRNMRCHVCHKMFHKRRLHLHLRQHKTAQLHRCPTCNVGFKLKGVLKKHLAKKVCFAYRDQNERRNSSADGNETIFPGRAIKESSFQGGEVSQCRLNEVGTFGKVEKPANKIGTCPKCLRPVRESHMKRHMNRHEMKAPYRCPHCDIGYIRKWDFDKHLSNKACDLSSANVRAEPVQNEMNAPYRCPNCDMRFKAEKVFKRHVAKKVCFTFRGKNVETRHKASRRKSCAKVKEVVFAGGEIQDSSIEGGEVSHRQLSEAVFGKEDRFVCRNVPCPKCSILVRTANYLLHLIQHEVDAPYRCPSCTLGFKYKAVFEKHLLSNICKISPAKAKARWTQYEKNAPHKCQCCDLRFKHEWALKKHESKQSCSALNFRRKIHPHQPGPVLVKEHQESPSRKLPKPLTEANLKNQHHLTECGLCHRLIPKKFAKRHRKLHSSKNKHVCPSCGLRFVSKQVLQTHFLKSCQGQVPESNHKTSLSCEKENWKASYSNSVVGHQSLSHRKSTGSVGKCRICHISVPSKLLPHHMRQHMKMSALRCSTCKLRFTHEQDLVYHKSLNVCEAYLSKGVTIVKPAEGASKEPVLEKPVVNAGLEVPAAMCPICDRNVHAQHMKTHMEWHTGKYTPVSKEDVEALTTSSEDEAPSRGSIPTKQAFSKKVGALSARSEGDDAPIGAPGEVRTSTNSTNQSFCFVCRENFPSGYIKAHMEKHSFKRVFACLVCRVTSGTRSGCTRHMLKHSDMEKMTCRLCNKIVNNVKNLETHALDHREDRMYKCLTCSKVLKDHYYLKSHFQKHLSAVSDLQVSNSKSKMVLGDIKPDVEERCCFVCNQEFSHASLLLSHMKTHEAEELAFGDTVTKTDDGEECDDTAVFISDVEDEEEEERGDRRHGLEMESSVYSNQNVDPLDNCDSGVNDSMDEDDSVCGGDLGLSDEYQEWLAETGYSLQNFVESEDEGGERALLLSGHNRLDSYVSTKFSGHSAYSEDRISERGPSFGTMEEEDYHKLTMNGGLSSEDGTEVAVFIDDENFEDNDASNYDVFDLEANDLEDEDPLVKSDNASDVSSSCDVGDPDVYCPADTSFECTICSKEFSSSSGLQTHMLLHSQENVHVCHVCSSVFQEKALLQKHMTEHGSGVGDCLSVSNMKVQGNAHASEAVQFDCDVCQRKFTRKCYLIRHMSAHRLFNCTLCSKTFTKYTFLTKHMVTHSETLEFPCTTCDSKFISDTALQRHIMKVHLQGTKLQTRGVQNATEESKNVSSNVDDRLTDLRCTRNKVKEVERETHTCEFCDKSLYSVLEYKKHIKMHKTLSQNNSYECKICGKVMKHLGYYLAHVRSHDGEREEGKNTLTPSGSRQLIQCELCGKAVKHKGNYTQHMKTHGNKARVDQEQNNKQEASSTLKSSGSGKVFSCEICGRIFNHKGNYNQHVRSHSNDKSLRNLKWRNEQKANTTHSCSGSGHPLQCKLCGKVMKHRGSYKMHMKSHQNDARMTQSQYVSQEASSTPTYADSGLPFQCKLCGKVMAHQGNYTNHMKSHQKAKINLSQGYSRETNSTPTFADSVVPFQCKVCGIILKHKGNYRQHMIIHGIKVGMDPSQYVSQETSSTPTCGDSGVPFQCQLCGKVMKHQGSYTMHMKTHQRKAKINQSQGYSQENNSTPTFADSVVPFQCKICGKILKHKGNYKQHMKIHGIKVGMDPSQYVSRETSSTPACGDSGVPFQCQLCDKVMKHQGRYIQHMKCHQRKAKINQSQGYSQETNSTPTFADSGVPFQCKFCCKVMKHQGSYTMHMKTHRNKAAKINQNQGSSQETNSTPTFADSGVPFQCKYCGKILKHKGNYTQHMKIHGIKVGMDPSQYVSRETSSTPTCRDSGVPFQCQLCGKVMKYQGRYIQHMKCHQMKAKINQSQGYSQETNSTPTFADSRVPFQCKICGKILKHKGNYKQHMKIHGIKVGMDPSQYVSRETSSTPACGDSGVPFQCQLCGKVMKHQGRYIQHMKCHQRKAKINQSQGYSQETNSTPTFADSGVPFQCKFCGKVMKHQGSYTMHMKTHRNKAAKINQNQGSSQETNSTPTFTDSGVPFQCKYCCKVMKHQGGYTNHMKTHRNKAAKINQNQGSSQETNSTPTFADIGVPFQCKFCGKVMKRQGSYTMHMKTHRNKAAKINQNQGSSQETNSTPTFADSGVPFQCKFCGKVMKHQGSYTMHMKSHWNKAKVNQCQFDSWETNGTLSCADSDEDFPSEETLSLRSTCHEDITSRPGGSGLWDKPSKRNQGLKLHVADHSRKAFSKGYDLTDGISIDDDSSDEQVTSQDTPPVSAVFAAKETNYINKSIDATRIDGGRATRNTSAKRRARESVESVCATIIDSVLNQQKEEMKLAARTCPHCGKVLPFKSLCLLHVGRHTKYDHQCLLCPKRFFIKKEFVKHIEGHENEVDNDDVNRSDNAVGAVLSSPRAAKNTPDNTELENISSNAYLERKTVRKSDILSSGKSVRRLRQSNEEEKLASRTCSHCRKVFTFESSCILHISKHSEKDHRCKICPLKFYSRMAFIKHSKSHENRASVENTSGFRKPYPTYATKSKVPMVGKGRVGQKGLPLKIRYLSEENLVRCSVCHERLPTYKSYYRHQRMHFLSSKNRCNLCSKKFRRRLSFLQHMRTHHGKTEGCNPDCDGVCKGNCGCPKPDEEDLIRYGRIKGEGGTSSSYHLDEMSSEDVASDDKLAKKCLVVLERMDESELEDRQSSPSPPVSGSQKKNTQHIENLIRKEVEEMTDCCYLEDHTKEDPYKCCVCKREFERVELIKDHLKEHRENVKCNICGKIISRLANLKRHMGTHLSLKSYKCRICNARYSRKIYLKNHIRKKHGDWSDESEMEDQDDSEMEDQDDSEMEDQDDCVSVQDDGEMPQTRKKTTETYVDETNEDMNDLAVAVPGEMDVNQSINHSSSQLDGFEGDIDKGISKMSSLFGSDFVCPICGKACMSVARFSSHLITHSKDLPFKCPFCQKLFKRDISFKKHLQDMHAADPSQFRPESLSSSGRDVTAYLPYKCAICDKGFMYDTGLKIHMMLHSRSNRQSSLGYEDTDYDCVIETNEDESTESIDAPSAVNSNIPTEKETNVNMDPVASDGDIEEAAIEIKEEVVDIDVPHDNVFPQEFNSNDVDFNLMLRNALSNPLWGGIPTALNGVERYLNLNQGD